MRAVITSLLLQAEEEVSEPKDIYPHAEELIIGAIAFAVLFVFMSKWVVPQINKALEQRRQKIQGDLEKAEQDRAEADKLLNEYREKLSGAREEANRIIEEARNTAEAMRRDLTAKAEQEYQAILDRAQDEIRAERDRVFQELKTQVGELSLQLAGRMVGESLDKDRQLRLVDQYIEELAEAAPSEDGQRG
jgi:F-type H+-transporting ATPase subunit b